jgi:hypothetical protein
MNGQNENNAVPNFTNPGQAGEPNPSQSAPRTFSPADQPAPRTFSPAGQPIAPNFSPEQPAGFNVPPAAMPSPGMPPVMPPVSPNIAPPTPIPVEPIPIPIPTLTPAPTYIPPATPPFPPLVTPAGQYTVPPAPSSEIGIRTMQSDAESLKQSGGLGAVPRTFSPADLSAAEPVFSPVGPSEIEKSQVAKGASKKAEKIMIFGIIFIAVATIIGIAVYFVIPRLFPKAPPAPVPAPTPVPTPTPAPAPAPAIIPHASLFAEKPELSQNLVLANNTLGLIKTNLAAAASREGIGANTFKEVSFIGENGSVIPFPALISQLAPSLTPELLSGIFEDDSTWFLYYGTKNIWPGAVVKIRSGVEQAKLDSFVASLESANLDNFFLEAPGTKGEFIDGNIGVDKEVRFSRFSNTGFVFEHGLFKKNADTYFVISTSYNGIKEAARRLGL